MTFQVRGLVYAELLRRDAGARNLGIAWEDVCQIHCDQSIANGNEGIDEESDTDTVRSGPGVGPFRVIIGPWFYDSLAKLLAYFV